MVEKSIFHYRQAIAIKPNYAAAYNNLAWVYATSIQKMYRSGQEAVHLATRACELTGFKNASMLDTLAAAFAEAGDFKSALIYQEKAIAMSEEKDQAPLRIRLRKYQSGQAHRSY
jgi:tetratricopeptide (TPR) repeat protein